MPLIQKQLVELTNELSCRVESIHDRAQVETQIARYVANSAHACRLTLTDTEKFMLRAWLYVEMTRDGLLPDDSTTHAEY